MTVQCIQIIHSPHAPAEISIGGTHLLLYSVKNKNLHIAVIVWHITIFFAALFACVCIHLTCLAVAYFLIVKILCMLCTWSFFLHTCIPASPLLQTYLCPCTCWGNYSKESWGIDDQAKSACNTRQTGISSSCMGNQINTTYHHCQQ